MEDHGFALPLDAERYNQLSKSALASEPKAMQQLQGLYEPVYFEPATILWSPGYQASMDPSGHFSDQPHSTGQDLNVYDETRQHLLSIPIAFLIEGGTTDRNALDNYIREAVHCSYHESGSLQWPSHAQDVPDASLDLVFVRDDGLLAPCQPQQGPHFVFPYGLFTIDELDTMTLNGCCFPDEEEDEWSDVDDDDDAVYGKEDSADETEEEEEEDEDEDDSIPSESKLAPVQRRDWSCILVDKGSPDNCMVLPLVSPKWLNQALGPQTKMSDSASSIVAEDHPSSNLLISLDLVGQWESGGISLYPASNGTYIVHVFRLYDPCLRPLHGKVIPRERFKCDDEHLLNPALVKYRYQQSVIKFLRGRSHGPLPCTTETLHNLIEERPGLFLQSWRDRIPGLSYESS